MRNLQALRAEITALDHCAQPYRRSRIKNPNTRLLRRLRKQLRRRLREYNKRNAS